jgi:PHD/YefM family antitoxin component YafN of YafNO toxin-antitoxin module
MPQFMQDRCRRGHPLAHYFQAEFLRADEAPEEDRPLVLTVNGKAEAVLLDAAAYQQLADYMDTLASIRRGLGQARKGEGRLADDRLGELERAG